MNNIEQVHYPSKFIINDCFIETAFEQRFQAILRHSWLQRSWHIVAAVPGSGKSYGVNDLVVQSGAYKNSSGRTELPILAIRAPKEDAKDLRLGVALSACFGTVPPMPSYLRRSWLVQAAIAAKVQCIIIDDAQDLNDHHLTFLKELTDNLAAPPYQQQIGLCLVVAGSGSTIPFRETWARPEMIWRQFRRRLDAERPFCKVLGHTVQEVREILASFETIYRNQLPNLHLCRWDESIHSWLINPILDPDATGRVTMHHLTQLVITTLRRSYDMGNDDIDVDILQSVAEMMISRRDEVISIDASNPDIGFAVAEIG
jgi:hypothetical protein